jgi:hypothetical protein
MGKIQILFLAANPKNTSKLKLEEEVRSIDDALREAEFRDRFNLETQFAVCLSNLQAHLLRYKPNIVHFSGHGSIAGEIIIEDNTGEGHPISSEALTQLFGVFKDTVRCVVLNACFTDEQAKAITQEIDCVIGMTKAIGDDSAVGFASSFYQAIGYGRNVKDAFVLGCNQINIANLNEQDTPQLLVRSGCNPQEIVFARASAPIRSKTPKKPEVDFRGPPTRLTAKMLLPDVSPKNVFRSVEKISVAQDMVKTLKIDYPPEKTPTLQTDNFEPSKKEPMTQNKAEQTFKVDQAEKTASLQTDKVEYHQGRILQTLGKFEDAIKHYDNALKLNPGFYEAWCGKGTNLYTLNTNTRNTKLLYESINCFDIASQINPQFTEAWYKKGLCLAKLGVVTRNLKILNEAIDCFNSALKINQQFAAGWCGKGVALDSLGSITHDVKNLSDAIDCFDRALKINPQFTEAYNRKALSEKTLRIWKPNSSS